MLTRMVLVLSLPLVLFSCASTKNHSSMPSEEQLKEIYGKLQKGAEAVLTFSVLSIETKEGNSQGVTFSGRYKIVSYQPNHEYTFTMCLVIAEDLIQIHQKRLAGSEGEIVVEKLFTDFVRSRLAKVQTAKVRLNIYKVLDEDLNQFQMLCQITSEEMQL